MAEPIPLPAPAESPPAGPNLELDPAFGEMERAAQGKPESQFGSTIEAATPPDWKEAATLATALLERTRDLRVLTMLAIAKLNLNDIVTFAAALSSIRDHIESMWDDVHPQLDPEDDNDPLLRANALLLLSDAGRVLRPLRDLPLATPGRARPVSWRDIAISTGAMEAEADREKLTEAQVRGAFIATEPARLAALRAAFDSIVADLAAIPDAFDAKAGPGQAPDFKDLPKLVHDIAREVARYQEMAAPAAADPVDAEVADLPITEAASASTPRTPRAVAAIQTIAVIHNRDDALHALALAAAYFRDNEPSSPLPLLLDRARRLAPLPFLEILRNLAPDGLQQAEIIAGPRDE